MAIAGWKGGKENLCLRSRSYCKSTLRRCSATATVPAVLLPVLTGRTRWQPGHDGLAAARIIAWDRRVGDQPLAPTHQLQNGSVETVDVLRKFNCPA